MRIIQAIALAAWVCGHAAGAQPSDGSAPSGAAQGALVSVSSDRLDAFRSWVSGEAPLTSAEFGIDAPGRVRPLLRRPPADPALAASLGLDRVFVVEAPPGQDAAALAEGLRPLHGWFERVEIDDVCRAHAGDSNDTGSSAIPDDPFFIEQYALHNWGQEIDGSVGLRGADISALGAWEITTGRGEVVVAVFDAGLSESHPDLAPKLVPGWNFLTDSDETDDLWTSHGTHCAGIIAAVTGNREGVAGIGWRTRLMPVVVLNKYGFGSESTLAEALVWAADQGVRVASVSLGFDPSGRDDRVLRNAVTYATERGMLICASAGNVPGDPIGAPARYPETIAVGATDNRDALWPGTSTGPEMDLAAPGVSIWSTWDSIWHSPGEDTYDMRTGTSQACPHVAGVAALMLSVNPRLGPLELMAILHEQADDLGVPGWDPGYGFGRVNAARAVFAADRSKDEGDLGDREPPCVADFNNDGAVLIDDFLLYLNAFTRNEWRADIADPRGVVNTLDLLAFLEAFQEGCNPRDPRGLDAN